MDAHSIALLHSIFYWSSLPGRGAAGLSRVGSSEYHQHSSLTSVSRVAWSRWIRFFGVFFFSLLIYLFFIRELKLAKSSPGICNFLVVPASLSVKARSSARCNCVLTVVRRNRISSQIPLTVRESRGPASNSFAFSYLWCSFGLAFMVLSCFVIADWSVEAAKGIIWDPKTNLT